MKTALSLTWRFAGGETKSKQINTSVLMLFDKSRQREILSIGILEMVIQAR